MNNEDRDNAITQILQAVTRIETRCQSCQTTLGEHHRVLDGDNRSPGLRAVSLVHQSLLEDHSKELRSLKTKIWKLAWGTLTLLAGLVVWIVDKLPWHKIFGE